MSIPRERAYLVTALGAALAGTSIALATPADAAPEGPDRGQDTVVEQAGEPAIVDVGRLGAAPMARSRVAGVPPGLAPLRPGQTWIFLGGG
ncbi:hypothetical protein L2K20_24115 [Mycobacterium sp. MBM]|nr:hypothetical protein [Mycobacterium sp. MBM]